jgi:hypothetical protein
MGMRTVSKARKLRRVYSAARVSLGTTLMKRDSSNAERDVPILRADFEVEFEADAFTIELGVSGLAASEKTDLTEAINVKAQPHRLRVLGIVLGEEMKLGEAVDLLRDVKEAAVIHYDDERLINGGFFMPNDHAGLTMFLTDSERLYEALCDEFDGVLIGEGQRVQQFDLAEIERHLEPVIEVR